MVPYQQVAVQARKACHRVDGAIVVIVRCTVVVLLSVAQLASDADDEHCPIFLRDGMFAFLRA